ncbi:MAG: zinc-ribbon domain-containing protein [Promethearchaeota archaeon]|jgi:uncharacterized membrane protein
MFCQNCGAQLTDENQKFCPSCGTEVQIAHKETTSAASPPPVYTEKSISVDTPFSKKTLVRGIASLIIAGGAAFAAFFNFIIRRIIPSLLPGAVIAAAILIVFFYSLGLVLGIAAIRISAKAKEEPENQIEKFGSFFAIVGILLNTLLLVFYLFLFLA